MTDINWWEALLVVCVPLLPLFFPGIVLINKSGWNNLLLGGSRILIWSLGLTILGSLVLSVFGVAPTWILIIYVLGSVLILLRAYLASALTVVQGWLLLAIVTPLIIGYAAFSVPYFFLHDGLPSGDAQKAIYWAQQMIVNKSLPDYSSALANLNRDPVDFYTPGLHSLTAAVMQASPAPLTSVGLLSIAVSLAVVWLAAALVKELFDDHPHIIPPIVGAFLVLTNFRWLRYLREPGYHWQNVVGEFFLFAMLLLGLHLLRKWRWWDFAAFIVSGLALISAHQFSAFMAAFVLLPLPVAWAIRYRLEMRRYLWQHAVGAMVALIVAAGGLLVAASLGLLSKLPHLFNTSPHLIAQTPDWLDYPVLLGEIWLLLGIGGLLLITLQTERLQVHYLASRAWLASTVIVLILSQGPRIFIDIPPVRALFYVVVPLSVTGAYLLVKFLYYARLRRLVGRNFFTAMMLLLVFGAGAGSVQRAFATTSHNARTNSTLMAEQTILIDYLAKQTTGAVLIDDYNRRSASWLLLGGRPLFARLAADLSQQMTEAGQSGQRYELYLKQLDFEKIFSLGSRPEVATLMDKYSVRWLTGIDGSSAAAFKRNPLLQPRLSARDTTVYELIDNRTCPTDSLCPWLLRASTLTNDIGDDEDTFAHLPASLAATRLSPPEFDGMRTYRLTTAPYIPLRFNIGDYVRILWDQENTNQPDTAIELLVQFAVQTPPLPVSLPSGRLLTLNDNTLLRIEPGDFVFDEQGFGEIIIHNPAQTPLAIDLIALGLARVP